MDLYGAIKEIVNKFGKEIIAEKRFFYMIADYYSFRDNPAEKRVLATLVDGGYTARLLKETSDGNKSIVLKQMLDDVCKNFGYRENIVESIVDNLAKGIGYVHPSDNEVSTINSKCENFSKEAKIQNFNKPGEDIQFRGEYDVEYLIYVFLKVQKFSNYHAHLDIVKFYSLLSLSTEETLRLFAFLKRIGVFKYNSYSQDYDLSVDTVDELKKKYNMYIYRQRGFKVPLPSGILISRGNIENLTRDLVKSRRTSIDIIKRELPMQNDKSEKAATELYYCLQNLKIIDKAGRNVSYLTPKLMADNIVMELCVNWSN